MGFAQSVKQNSRKVLHQVNQSAYGIAKELFSHVVKLTPSPSHPGPYAVGHLANQWYPSEGDFSEELDSRTSDTGADSLSRIASLKGGAFNMRDGVLTLTNNLSYAYRAEYLGWPASEGWSGRIGPYHMVSLSIQTVAAKYQ